MLDKRISQSHIRIGIGIVSHGRINCDSGRDPSVITFSLWKLREILKFC